MSKHFKIAHTKNKNHHMLEFTSSWYTLHYLVTDPNMPGKKYWHVASCQIMFFNSLE